MKKMPIKKKSTKSKVQLHIKDIYYKIYTYKENEEPKPLGIGSDNYLRILDEFNQMLSGHLKDKDFEVDEISDTLYKAKYINSREADFYELKNE